MKNKKGMSFQTVLMVIAVIGLTISLIVFFPNTANAKDSFFNLLGLGSTCRETGESYQKHLHDLQQAILKEDYEKTAELYEIMKRCFSRRENDIKKEAMDSFNAYVEKVDRVIDGDGFLAIFRFMKNTIGTGLKETDKLKRLVRNAYLDAIKKRLDKINEYRSKAESPPADFESSGYSYTNHDGDWAYILDCCIFAGGTEIIGQREFEKLKALCQEGIEYQEIKTRIKLDCDEKIRQANSSLRAIDCLYETAIGIHWLNECENTDYSVSDRISYCVEAYTHYGLILGKYRGYTECDSSVNNANAKVSMVLATIARLDPKKPPINYVCGYIFDELNRWRVIPNNVYYTCRYLKRINIECIPCELVPA